MAESKLAIKSVLRAYDMISTHAVICENDRYYVVRFGEIKPRDQVVYNGHYQDCCDYCGSLNRSINSAVPAE